MRRHCPMVFVAFLLTSFSTILIADTINYGDFRNEKISFFDVRETYSSNPDNPGPIFGAPEMDGDMMRFYTEEFRVQGANSQIGFVDGRLTMTLEADPGCLIGSINVREFGSYFLDGADSSARIHALGVVEIDGDLYSDSFALEFNGTGQGSWQEDLLIQFPPTDRLTFTLDQQLFASGGGIGLGFTDNLGTLLSANFAATPEPQSIFVCLLGFSLVSARRKNKF